ncbi:M23 family metallopeptidase [Arthrobacter sp. V4I6]|uniref:M23 family metallopeptidase n=2 Tax=unclassified Arthrobacter TaxID=235627 RepID=UPI0027D9116F|nr:M23 family metallopeptidase [Arthrobacter sp. V4I6]
MRCLSGGFCLSLAVLTFGVQGLAGSVSQPAPNTAPATGAVGPSPLGAVIPAIPAAPAAVSIVGEALGALTADASALVAFTRSMVETSSELGGPGELNVASASLQRPAPGWLLAPLESLRESSSYGLRTSPLTGHSGEFHWGQDYAAACGTRVYSADAGVVRAVGWHPWGGGNRVEIDHGNGLITTYNHLEAIAVKKGDSVRVGEVIARVGTTGSSTGCHLHFETILNGAHADPHRWNLLPTTQVDPLGAFEMISFEPEANKSSNASIGWAIPVRDDRAHEVAGGVQETPVAVAPPSSPLIPSLPGLTLTPDSPTPDAPTTGTPKPDAPTTGTPKPDAPTTGTPKPDAPTTGTPKPDAPTTGTPKPDAPTTGTPKPDAPTTGTPKPDAPTTGTPKPDAPTTGTPKPDAPTTGTPKPDAPTTGTPKPDAPTTGTPKPDAPTTGTPTPSTATSSAPAPTKPPAPSQPSATATQSAAPPATTAAPPVRTTAPAPATSKVATVSPSTPAAPSAPAAPVAPKTPVPTATPVAPTSSVAQPKKSPAAPTNPASPTTRTATPSAAATEAAATRTARG